MTTTKDIIEAVRAVQGASGGNGPFKANHVRLEQWAVIDANWDPRGFYDLTEDEAHALAHLLNLDLDGVTE